MCGDIAEQALRLVGQPQFFNVGNPSDVSISQLKQHCSAYRRIIPLYKLSIKNGKSHIQLKISEVILLILQQI